MTFLEPSKGKPREDDKNAKKKTVKKEKASRKYRFDKGLLG